MKVSITSTPLKIGKIHQSSSRAGKPRILTKNICQACGLSIWSNDDFILLTIDPSNKKRYSHWHLKCFQESKADV